MEDTSSTPLLTTKFHIHPVRHNIVHRRNLIDRLNGGVDRKLTVVSAPAGFGKTTLISEWVESLRPSAASERLSVRRIAWLSLDDNDNDFVRFLTYFAGALQSVKPEGDSIGAAIGALLRAAQPPPPGVISTVLVNQIAALKEPIIFILDDYHFIDTEDIHSLMAFLVEHMPAQMHLVIATRHDPPFVTARLRAQNELTEVRAADLRFGVPEVTEFMNRTMNLELSTEEVNKLEARTEGWAAGLQMAAMSIHGRNGPTDLIESFAGSHRHVTDYLLQEVLNRQNARLQMFLLQTSILDQMTGNLCDALTGESDGQGILETLEKTNLFIVPLDDERRWYRYHQLFADLLRERLHQAQPGQTATLHSAASQWYERNGYPDQAIEFALKAKDFESATRLIAVQADSMWQHGEHTRLNRWICALPPEFLVTSANLCVHDAWMMLVAGRLEAARTGLETAERAVSSDAQDTSTPGRIAAMRASLASRRGQIPEIIGYAQEALECLVESDTAWRGAAAVALGDALGLKGEVAAAYHARVQALDAYMAAGDVFMTLATNALLALNLKQQGQLQKTAETCERQMRFAHESGVSEIPVVGALLAIWGEVLAELNDLGAALQRASQGVAINERGMDVAMLAWSYMCLARVLLSRGEVSDAAEVLNKMEGLAAKHELPAALSSPMSYWRVRILLVQDRLSLLSEWAQERGLDLEGDLPFLRQTEYIALCRILIAEGRVDEALELLHRLLEGPRSSEHVTRAVEVWNLEAIAFCANYDDERAMDALERALALAEPTGFIRIFVDEGPQMANLLYKAAARGIAPEYARRVLSAFPVLDPDETPASETRVDQSGLFEPLSERELDVLRLIGEGLSNNSIGTRLFISTQTVKTHTRNIYAKVGAHSRTEALAKARGLGILP